MAASSRYKKEILAKNLPVVAERDSYYCLRTDWDLNKLNIYSETKGLHGTSPFASVFFED